MKRLSNKGMFGLFFCCCCVIVMKRSSKRLHVASISAIVRIQC